MAMTHRYPPPVALVMVPVVLHTATCMAQSVQLPPGVKAVWDIFRAYREVTLSRERVCVNGLWRWQPAQGTGEAVPEDGWGYFKVPGCWPGREDWLQKDCQTVFAHPTWQDANLGEVTAAWYQREITIPMGWIGRRITVTAQYLNSYAAVFLDGRQVGEMRFPAGEVDLTAVCRPGSTHVLTMLVVAMPLKSVMMSFSDTSQAREVAGVVERRGLCGDVWLVSTPAAERIADVKVDTSVRKWEITIEAGLEGLRADGNYAVRAEVFDHGEAIAEFVSPTFSVADLHNGRFRFSAPWKPQKLWDIHTPENMYDLTVTLQSADGQVLDTYWPVHFGFREFWISGRDFMLNGTRIFLSNVPLDNALIGAAWSTYGAARETLERLKAVGINFVYGHNYGCEPGTHLSLEEILQAADDVGMLVAISQPHFGQYDWQAADADTTNGYARHAEFYVRVCQNHPSVVAYSMSHNATGYVEGLNPDMMDGIQDPRESWAKAAAARALRAEAIVKRFDPSRIVYHHSSGNLGAMITHNFYPNFAPIQELDDWFAHWATVGVKPLFLCEYGAPLSWDFTMYRGWYRGTRTFGSAVVPWELCLAEWNAQFLGDTAYQISELEKRCLRWEAQRFREGRLWHRWDYPREIGSTDFAEMFPVMAAYITSNWRAFRTWGVSAINAWEYDAFWKLRPDVNRNRVELPVDWDNLQRPGFSPDYIASRYERRDVAYELSDWVPTPAGEAYLRNNQPLLAYIAGKPEAFTSRDHNYLPGEAVDKQIIIINNSREAVNCDCRWTLDLPRAATGNAQLSVPTGEQQRIPLHFELPPGLAPGRYTLTATVQFSNGETQTDSLALDVLSATEGPPAVSGKLGLFDPGGETAKLLSAMGLSCEPVFPDTDLSSFETLIVGKGALTPEGPAPDIRRVRDGLKVIVFEQTAEALEKRLGFRVAEYGLRNVFRRVPDHPAVNGLTEAHLHDWRGVATLCSPRLEYTIAPSYQYTTPVVQWCGIDVPRIWRCGCRGNVASVLIEKPACGDFLPILDGGYSLQYSPLLEYREGAGMILFCQMDVTGRTEADPAANRLVRNLLGYIASWHPAPRRQALYVGDPLGRRHLERAGIRPGVYRGGPLSTDQVLIVGQGGGTELAPHRAAVADFLAGGGRVLALALDAQRANAFLPFDISTQQAEHIASYFEPFSGASPIVGISPADVHNRGPRELPLVMAGASVVGDGVLAFSADGHVVFDQLPPYIVTASEGEAAGFEVDAQDAAEGERSAVVSMGAATEAGGQFGQTAKFEPRVGQSYTCAVLVKSLRGPLRLHLEVERAGHPWDRAVKGPEVLLPEGEWTEVHVTFPCEKPFPEGWQAYIACSQDGARFRADAFRLYEGDYAPWQPGKTAPPPNLLANPSFEQGEQPWWFNTIEQYNLRRTYRRASFTLSRLLANLGVSGKTPLLERFALPVGEAEGEVPPGPSVVRNGDFSVDADGDGMPDQWHFQPTGQATCTREQADAGWALRMEAQPGDSGRQAGVMLAQHELPMREGQWYRIRVKARGEGMGGARVALTVANTKTWTWFFDAQYFTPQERWRTFQFLVRSKAGADGDTRLQIWHENPGVLWLADLAVQAVGPPTAGRWERGLYLDQPVAWDDPYRYFCW